jgi:hypothetical protein
MTENLESLVGNLDQKKTKPTYMLTKHAAIPVGGRKVIKTKANPDYSHISVSIMGWYYMYQSRM